MVEVLNKNTARRYKMGYKNDVMSTYIRDTKYYKSKKYKPSVLIMGERDVSELKEIP